MSRNFVTSPLKRMSIVCIACALMSASALHASSPAGAAGAYWCTVEKPERKKTPAVFPFTGAVEASSVQVRLVDTATGEIISAVAFPHIQMGPRVGRY